ncbi:hypothetical protein Cylst_6425 (plasmid) [Cylindrospermum stagnale PCC 7417]|uniref:Uncharacterized protein n=1 Tax=Cylindrospermum stagnale PCC 7417 TaxID=56107 RepID=K9X6V3_9NOST|nr:hypothetical protein [Cylindrospermum stagnale]AFZ28218.1 hypothetical protein Cylst_6425 [Cylindrospermum stagnale PCC 7417]
MPTRLGHIASNLARIRTFCNTAYKEAVESVTDETLWFIEWTAAEIEPEYAEELVNIQVKLARWKLTFDNILSNDKERRKIAEQSSALSQRVLDMSGLLSESLA